MAPVCVWRAAVRCATARRLPSIDDDNEDPLRRSFDPLARLFSIKGYQQAMVTFPIGDSVADTCECGRSTHKYCNLTK